MATLRLGLYADNAGYPGIRIASTRMNLRPTSTGWNTAECGFTGNPDGQEPIGWSYLTQRDYLGFKGY